MKKILCCLIIISMVLTAGCGKNTAGINVTGMKKNSDCVNEILMSEKDSGWTIELNSVSLTDAYVVMTISFYNDGIEDGNLSKYMVNAAVSLNGEEISSDINMLQQVRKTKGIQQELLLGYDKNYPNINTTNSFNADITLMETMENHEMKNVAKCRFTVDDLQYEKSNEISSKLKLDMDNSITLDDICVRQDNGYISISYDNNDLINNDDYFIYASDEEQNKYAFTYMGHNIDGKCIMKAWMAKDSELTELKQFPDNCRQLQISIYQVTDKTSKRVSTEKVLELN